MSEVRTDTYQLIINAIIEALEAYTRTWIQSWNPETIGSIFARPIRSPRQPYRGINGLLLWLASAANNFHISKPISSSILYQAENLADDLSFLNVTLRLRFETKMRPMSFIESIGSRLRKVKSVSFSKAVSKAQAAADFLYLLQKSDAVALCGNQKVGQNHSIRLYNYGSG